MVNEKISVIVGTRNDGHGGYAKERFTFSINSFLKNFDEVVVVDWASPNGVTMFDDVKQFLPKTNKLVNITVTPDDIDNLGYPTDVPMSEVHCRNIALRRVSHDIVLSTNPDIVITEPVKFEVKPDLIYFSRRRDTWDFRQFNINEADEFYHHVNSNILSWEPKPFIPRTAPDKWSKVVCCGDFQLARTEFWHKLLGFESGMPYRSFSDTNVQKKAHIYGNGVEFCDHPLAHLNHDGHDMIIGGVSARNDQDEWIYNFQESKNEPTWGAPAYKFKVDVW